jgi:ATP-dependent Clp protease ATP-binding subunit ClpA
MALETFSNTLGNAYLQRHLLAIQATTLEQAVRAGNEFVQIKPPTMPGSAIRTIDEPEEVIDKVASINPDMMSILLKTMQQLSEKVEQLQIGKKTATNDRTATTRSTGCWGCGQEGHTRRTCTANPWPSQNTATNQGNGRSPQQ